jgi:hypothetical protein
MRKQIKQAYNDHRMPQDMAWAISLMVNCFLRPGDLTKLKHRHVEVLRGKNTYLRLTLPETKLHSAPIVTLRPAVRVYQQICKLQPLTKPNDYVLGFWQWLWRCGMRCRLQLLNTFCEFYQKFVSLHKFTSF